MGTDARFLCPVCSERYDAPPAECFRCETPLRSWWRFEEAVERSRSQQPRSPRILPIAIAALAGALVAAAAVRITTRTAHAPGAAPAAPAVPLQASAPATPRSAAAPPAPVSAPPRLITYRVQPGDSLWRIAAALTGDGRNWKTLWPAMDPARPLAVGTVLELPIR